MFVCCAHLMDRWNQCLFPEKGTCIQNVSKTLFLKQTMNTELKLNILTNLQMKLSLAIAVSRLYEILLEMNMANLPTE